LIALSIFLTSDFTWASNLMFFPFYYIKMRQGKKIVLAMLM